MSQWMWGLVTSFLTQSFTEKPLSSTTARKKLHTEHLYQLFSYPVNRRSEKGACEGILLYPTVDVDLDSHFTILGFPIRIRTLNLARSWQEIHSDLIEIIHRDHSKMNFGCLKVTSSSIFTKLESPQRGCDMTSLQIDLQKRLHYWSTPIQTQVQHQLGGHASPGLFPFAIRGHPAAAWRRDKHFCARRRR
jgi:hypothetical protein